MSAILLAATMQFLLQLTFLRNKVVMIRGLFLMQTYVIPVWAEQFVNHCFIIQNHLKQFILETTSIVQCTSP